MDFLSEQNLDSTKNRTMDLFDGSFSYALNRRFMILATGYYEWLNSRVSTDVAEASAALGGRLQLIDIPGSSYALNVKFISPAKTLGNDLTTATYTLAGWQDLTPYGLKKVGLYFDVGADNYIGPHPIGTKTADGIYDVSLAKTWTQPTDSLQNLSTFVELYGSTNLSGSESGQTVITLTPGFRTGLSLHQILMAGVDLPVSHPRPYNWAFRVTYIITF